jgi:hypothetical protein
MNYGMTALSLAGVLLLSACGDSSGLSGTYGDLAKNGAQFIFKSGDQVTIKLDGLSTGRQGTYKVNGHQVAVFDPSGMAIPLTIDDNGCLTGNAITGAACEQ